MPHAAISSSRRNGSGPSSDGLRPLDRHEADPLALPCNRWLEDAGYLLSRGCCRPNRDRACGIRTELEDALADEQPPFAEIDFGATRAYCFGYGGQIYLGEVTGAEEDRGLANELAEGLAEVTHPESGEPPSTSGARRSSTAASTSTGHRNSLVPRDERVHVDSTRQRWSETFQRHEHLFARGTAHFSGQHAVTGILAAAGPGIGRAAVPAPRSRRFRPPFSPFTGSRRSYDARRSRRSWMPSQGNLADKSVEFRRRPSSRPATRGGGSDRSPTSGPRVRVAQGRLRGGPEPVSSTGPRSTSRSLPGGRSRPVGSTSGRSNRRDSTPHPRSSTRCHTASSPADRRTGTFPGRMSLRGRTERSAASCCTGSRPAGRRTCRCRAGRRSRSTRSWHDTAARPFGTGPRRPHVRPRT